MGRVGSALGRFQAAMTLGAAAAPIMGGLLADTTLSGWGSSGGLRLAFAVCGGIALVCSAAALVLLPTLRPRGGRGSACRGCRACSGGVRCSR